MKTYSLVVSAATLLTSVILSPAQTNTFPSSGSAGIGTTSPDALLHVETGANSSQIEWATILNNPNLTNDTGFGVGLKLMNTDGTDKWAGIAAVAGWEYSNETDLVFYTGNFDWGNNVPLPPSEKMRIKSDTGDVTLVGNVTAPVAYLSQVGINRGLASGYVAAINGNVHVTGTVTQTSDRAFKTDIAPLADALKVVLAVEPVKYRHKNESDGRTHYGVIANDIKLVVPDIVHGEAGSMAVAYGELIPVLIQAVKEQQAQIEDLKKQVSQHK